MFIRFKSNKENLKERLINLDLITSIESSEYGGSLFINTNGGGVFVINCKDRSKMKQTIDTLQNAMSSSEDVYVIEDY